MTTAISVLVCSVAERYSNAPVVEKLLRQAELHDNVEVIILTDNRKMSIGQKRNNLVSMATGEYVVFVDDDDDVADDYTEQLVRASNADTDVIVFSMAYWHNGVCGWRVEQSLGSPLHGYRSGDVVHITPHHTSAVKRDIAIRVPFDDMSYGEDRLWAEKLQRVAQTETVISKVLYTYHDVPKTSVARQYAQDYDPVAYDEWKDAQ